MKSLGRIRFNHMSGSFALFLTQKNKFVKSSDYFEKKKKNNKETPTK